MRDRRLLLVAGALVAGGVAVSPPVDARADGDLVWHMAQHLVLLAATGPLLVVAGLGAWRERQRPVPVRLAIAGAVLNVVMVVGWHAPALFDAAERATAVHVLEHLSLVAASGVLWWSAGLGRRPAPLAATLVVFVSSLPGIALGAAMTLSTTPWYAAYPDVTRQQVAGALMWSLGGLVTIVCGVLSCSRALVAHEALT